jgi:peptidoglycan/LPS O-acetylase OafA/YrhL
MPPSSVFRAADRRLPGFPQLTTLRFLAAMLVLGSHLGFLAQHAQPVVRDLYDCFLSRGYIGVSFFYVLSGFVLGHAYERRLRDRTISRAHYFSLRIARIFPLHWIVTAPLLFWVLLKGHEPTPSTVILNLSLLQTWVADISVYFSLNGPSWSISNEIFFSLLLPWLVLIPTPSLKRLLIVGAGLVALLAIAVQTPAGLQVFPVRIHQFLFEINPVVRTLEFAVGLLMLRLYRENGSTWKASTAAELVALATWPAMMLGLSFSGLPSAFHQLLTLPLMATLIYVMARGGGQISRLLSRRWLVLLGDASFALYLTHLLIVNFTEVVAGKLGYPPGLLVATGLAIFCVLFSVLVHCVLERPLHYYLRDRLDRYFTARDNTRMRQGHAGI